MTDKFSKKVNTSVFHVMQTVICITEDLRKVIHIVIGLVWFSFRAAWQPWLFLHAYTMFQITAKCKAAYHRLFG